MPFLSGEQMRKKMRVQVVRNGVEGISDPHLVRSKAREIASKLDTEGPHELAAILKIIEADTVAEEFRQTLNEMEGRLNKRFDSLEKKVDDNTTNLQTQLDDTSVKLQKQINDNTAMLQAQLRELTDIVRHKGQPTF